MFISGSRKKIFKVQNVNKDAASCKMTSRWINPKLYFYTTFDFEENATLKKYISTMKTNWNWKNNSENYIAEKLCNYFYPCYFPCTALSTTEQVNWILLPFLFATSLSCIWETSACFLCSFTVIDFDRKMARFSWPLFCKSGSATQFQSSSLMSFRRIQQPGIKKNSQVFSICSICFRYY